MRLTLCVLCTCTRWEWDPYLFQVLPQVDDLQEGLIAVQTILGTEGKGCSLIGVVPYKLNIHCACSLPERPGPTLPLCSQSLSQWGDVKGGVGCGGTERDE